MNLQLENNVLHPEKNIYFMPNYKTEINKYFIKNDYKHVKNNMRNYSNEDLINKWCFLYSENHIIINYSFFKCMTKYNIYNNETIIQYTVDLIKKVLLDYPNFIIHLNTNNLTIIDVDKHYHFIKNISFILKQEFPDKLDKCYVYNSPFIMSKIFSIISVFIDRITLQKITMVDLSNG